MQSLPSGHLASCMHQYSMRCGAENIHTAALEASRGEIISHIFMIGEIFATLRKLLKVKLLPSHRNYEREELALLMLRLKEMALRSWKKTLLGHKTERRPTSSSKGFKYMSKRGEST